MRDEGTDVPAVPDIGGADQSSDVVVVYDYETWSPRFAVRYQGAGGRTASGSQ